MSIGERILELRKFLELTQGRFSEIIGTTQNVISLIEHGKLLPTEKQVQIIISRLHVTPQWINFGEGEMFAINDFPKSQLTTEQIDKIINIQEAHQPISTTSVPFYDIPINGASIIKVDEKQITPKYSIDYPPFNDCEFYRPIYGESMAPRFKNGDIVACRKISGQEYVMYGDVYLCSFRRGNNIFELLRVIRQHENRSLLSLVALNHNYDTLVISKSSIQSLHIIKGKIERFV